MKNYIKLLIVLMMSILTLTWQSSCSQNKISGKVIDAVSRQPLENVTVTDGFENGCSTITDQYGNFRLVSKENIETISFSFVGYKSIVQKNNGEPELKIDMQQNIYDLKDVIVIQNNIATKFSTVTKIDLDLKPAKNTQELLSLVPGLFIAQHAGGGKAEQIFLRGFDCDHGTDVKVSIDGMPVNMVSHAHGQGYADAHFIIPETINKVDFGAGPYYTQHGNLNTAGYVSFGTYVNVPNSRVQIEAGNFDTYRGLYIMDIIRKNKDKQSAWLASEFNYTNGPALNKQSLKRFNLFGKYNLTINSRNHLSASISSFSSKWDASGQVPERAVAKGLIKRFGSIDPSEGGNTERHNANFLLAQKFSNGALWENQAYYSRYKFNLYSNFTFFLKDTINGDEINQAEQRNIFGYQTKFSQRYTAGNYTVQSMYGAGVRHDVIKDSKLANVVNRKLLGIIKFGDIKETNAYAFVQQQLSHGRWLIDAGARVDYFYFNYFDKFNTVQKRAQSTSIVSPKINIQYTINPTLQFFVKTGKGFHSNDARVVVATDAHEILPAAYGFDLGIILRRKGLIINLAAWHLYLNQEFVYVGDEGITEPSGKTRREGIDVIARYQFTKNLFATMNLNLTRPRAIGKKSGEDYIPLSPTVTSNGGFFYKAAKGFNGSITCRYIKSRAANEDYSIIAKGYCLLDASVNYTQPAYEIGIAIENMLNTEWNEAQFATTSRLRNEPGETTELNFTPGTPFFARIKLALFF